MKIDGDLERFLRAQYDTTFDKRIKGLADSGHELGRWVAIDTRLAQGAFAGAVLKLCIG